MTSVTAYINRFVPPFNEAEAVAAYAKKHNKTEVEVLADWHAKRDAALEDGKQFEQDVVDALAGKKWDTKRTVSDRYKAAVFAVKKLIKEKQGKLRTLQPQTPISNGEVKGVVDFFCDGKKPFLAETKYMKAELSGFGTLLEPFTAFDNAKVFVCAMQVFSYLLIVDEPVATAALLGCDKTNRDGFFFFLFKKQNGKITCESNSYSEKINTRLNALAKIFVEQWNKDN